jgi:hypothetical protein
VPTEAELRALERISFAKVAEYQRRGAVHFHAIIRLDAAADCACPSCVARPPAGFTVELLEGAVRRAATIVSVPCPPVTDDQGVTLTAGWGEQLDVRHITETGDEQGTKVRLTLGDPDSEAVRRRGEEEGIGDGLAARVRLGLLYLREAIGAPGVELRFHATTLYNSLYRFDDDLLVNAHVYGAPAAHSPVLHLRRLPGGQLVNHYQASFERVWEQASTDNMPAVLAQGERR